MEGHKNKFNHKSIFKKMPTDLKTCKAVHFLCITMTLTCEPRLCTEIFLLK